MKIGILGAGNVGTRLAELARAAGHDVLVGSRKGDASLADASRHGDIILIAVHYHAVEDALKPLSELLAGKIVIDATNPLNDDWSPRILGENTSAGEEIAKLLPNSKIVKAFNTVFADIMSTEGLSRNGSAVTAFVASDHDDAVKTVADFAKSIGFAPVTSNKLIVARYLEAIAHLNIELAVGQGGGTNAAFLYHRG